MLHTVRLRVIDTTNLVLAIFDDARAALDPEERAAFEEEVARYATLHYQKVKLKGVAVVVGRASRRGQAGDDEPILFVPEYHPDGSVRMALLRRPAPGHERRAHRIDRLTSSSRRRAAL